MKSVLCTGVSGFIGQHLSRAFIEKGWTVFGVDNELFGNSEWLPKEVEFVKLDVNKPFKWTTMTFDLVVHLASRKIPRYESAHKTLIENTQGVLHTANFAKEINAKFIYLSTSDAYGKNKEFSETSDSIIGPSDISRWSYAITKLWGEQLLYSMPKEFKFNIVRLFNTYGPYYSLSWMSGPVSVFISQALKKEPITIHGDGYQTRSFQYVSDAVDGIMRLAESDCNREVFNIGNPDGLIPIILLAQEIWKLINPNEAMKWEHVEYSPLKYEDVQARVPDISKAKKMLGFEPKVGLAEGLAKTIEWQRGVM